MKTATCALVLLLLSATEVATAFDLPPLLAQSDKLGLSPENRKKYDELMRRARRNEIIGYVAGGASILLVIVALPLKGYFDRKKRLHQPAHKADGKQ